MKSNHSKIRKLFCQQIRDLSNRGQLFSQKAPFYVMVLFIMTILSIIFLILVWKLGSVNIAAPKNLESFIFMQRFINSPLCFSASDEEFSYFFDTLDVQKFNQNTLDNCYSIDQFSKFKDKKVKAFRLTVRNIKDGSERVVTTLNFWDSAVITKISKEITIYDKGELSKGLFIVEFQNA